MFSGDRNRVFSSHLSRGPNARQSNLDRLTRKVGKNRVMNDLKKRITNLFPTNSPNTVNKSEWFTFYSLYQGIKTMFYKAKFVFFHNCYDKVQHLVMIYG